MLTLIGFFLQLSSNLGIDDSKVLDQGVIVDRGEIMRSTK